MLWSNWSFFLVCFSRDFLRPVPKPNDVAKLQKNTQNHKCSARKIFFCYIELAKWSNRLNYTPQTVRTGNEVVLQLPAKHRQNDSERAAK